MVDIIDTLQRESLSLKEPNKRTPTSSCLRSCSLSRIDCWNFRSRAASRCVNSSLSSLTSCFCSRHSSCLQHRQSAPITSGLLYDIQGESWCSPRSAILVKVLYIEWWWFWTSTTVEHLISNPHKTWPWIEKKKTRWLSSSRNNQK